jgi:hypothetical protein
MLFMQSVTKAKAFVVVVPQNGLFLQQLLLLLICCSSMARCSQLSKTL